MWYNEHDHAESKKARARKKKTHDSEWDNNMTTDDSLAAGDQMTTIARAARTAAAPVRVSSGDTMALVQKGLPEPGKFVSRFAYRTCYYTSYCAVFAAVFVANFVPGLGPLAAGVKDGAEAASRYVGETRANAAARKQHMLKSAANACETAPVVA